jgi:CO/xanthine dehydrogenase Mo-binding subunit
MGCFEPEFMVEDVGGPKAVRTMLPPLALDRVRYVGERVAVVIADTEAQARDAAELVSVDYEVLPAVVDIANAMRPDAPLVHDGITGNLSFTMSVGDAAAAAQAFARAHHVTKLSLHNSLQHGTSRLCRRFRSWDRSLHPLYQHSDRARRPADLGAPDPAYPREPHPGDRS